MKKQNLVAKIILVLSLLSVLLLIVTPMQFLNFKGGIHAIWGWTGIFGGDMSLNLGEVEKVINIEFNWVIYVACILTVIMGVTTYLIAPNNKGYFIFSAIVSVILAIIFFTTKTWLNVLINWPAGNAGYIANPLGVGPWFAGLAASFTAIASIVANRMTK